MLYPFVFEPILKERIWGGRRLAALYDKPLPADVPVGESWEISDRPGDVTVISNGPLCGQTLRWLMEHHGAELLGATPPADGGRFPLLCKILDARDRLSLQVHPPATMAAALRGEPKTEMWYIADAEPGAELFVGLRAGTTRAEFEAKVRSGEVAQCFHRIAVAPGDTMFLPSGRVHAIGAGLVIFEIQQNSDTTYRVFDWNRTDRDGQPRELHLEQSLASIDFADVEPALVSSPWVARDRFESRALVRHELFSVDLLRTRRAATLALGGGPMRVVACVDGELTLSGGELTVTLHAGQFALVPASLPATALDVAASATSLLVQGGA